MTRYIGCHVSAAGGLENALTRGEELGVNTIQIHPCPPQRWNTKPFAAGVEDKFLERFPTSSVKKLYFHAIYLINLANPDPAKVSMGRSSLINSLELAGRMGASGVIFHVGSAKEQPSMEAALKQAAKAVSVILDKAKGEARLLLEVSAGSGSIVGARMEELREIYDMVDNRQRLGFALDTQHMWASGYDLVGEKDKVIKEIGDIFGYENVYAIHVNDSKSDLASRVDRHANIGEGKIGAEGLKHFLAAPELKNIPLILETPGLKDPETAATEIARLKAIVEVS